MTARIIKVGISINLSICKGKSAHKKLVTVQHINLQTTLFFKVLPKPEANKLLSKVNIVKRNFLKSSYRKEN